MTNVRVWLSADGYRDPDDNLGLLVGAALTRTIAKGTDNVAVAGVVFGDTKDGGQFRMLNPWVSTQMPAAIDDGDARYSDAYNNQIAAGNYAFYDQYAEPALKKMAPGWDFYDLLAEDPTGRDEWNYAATRKSEMTLAAWDLAQDIKQAVAAGTTRGEPNDVVAYSAGGGAHVPAEAIAYLRGQGYSETDLVRHFAVIQHGDTNWWSNQEVEARDITRAYTIVISEQDPNSYADGSNGPGLKWMVRDGEYLEGDRFGTDFAEALDVAQGLKSFENQPARTVFKSTKDGSDAGSHAFAADVDNLMAAWGNRLGPNENVANNQPHLIDTGSGYRSRVMYDEFDWRDSVSLMNDGVNGLDLL